jgi:hypothetical protein
MAPRQSLFLHMRICLLGAHNGVSVGCVIVQMPRENWLGAPGKLAESHFEMQASASLGVSFSFYFGTIFFPSIDRPMSLAK